MRRLRFVAACAAVLACSSSKDDAGTAPTWTRQFATPQWDAVIALATDQAGNVLAAGGSEGALFGPVAGVEDAFVLQLDPAGRTSWARQLGSGGEDFALAIASGPGGRVFVAGATTGSLAAPAAGGYDLFVARLDADGGATVWSAQRGTPADDRLNRIAVDAVGRVFVLGLTGGDLGGVSLGGQDLLVARLDPDGGTTVWARHVGSAAAEGAPYLAVGGGHVLVSGDSDGVVAGAVAGGRDVFAVALDPDTGATAWARQLGTALDDRAGGVAVDPVGNVVVAFSTSGDLAGPGAGARDVAVVKLDPTGQTTIWARQLGTTADDVAVDVATDAAGNVHVAGQTLGALAGTSAGSWDVFLVQLSPAGDPIWTRQLGTATYDGLRSLAVDAAGNVFLAVESDGGLDDRVCAGNSDGYVVKYGPDGVRY